MVFRPDEEEVDSFPVELGESAGGFVFFSESTALILA